MKATILFLIFFLPLALHTQPQMFGFNYKYGIVTFGYKPSKSLIKIIKTRLWSVYRVKSDFLGLDTLPGTNDVPSYDSLLLKHRTGKYKKIVGVTEKMLWRNFYFDDIPVYGSSLEKEGISIISSARIDDEEEINDTTTANIVTHEAGHLFGLDHCDDTLCLMTAYGRLMNCCLCLKCQAKLKGLVRFYKPLKR